MWLQIFGKPACILVWSQLEEGLFECSRLRCA
jgi:hypothetical protein